MNSPARRLPFTSSPLASPGSNDDLLGQEWQSYNIIEGLISDDPDETGREIDGLDEALVRIRRAKNILDWVEEKVSSIRYSLLNPFQSH